MTQIEKKKEAGKTMKPMDYQSRKLSQGRRKQTDAKGPNLY